jgi:hypothetical protein
MVRKVFKPEQIINDLRDVEVLLNQGSRYVKLAESCVSPGTPSTAEYRGRLRASCESPVLQVT